MTRKPLRLGLSLVLVSLLVLATIFFSAPASAAVTRPCAAPQYPGDGYFTMLDVTRTTCKTGRRVMLAHYRCRRDRGVTRTCNKSVLRFRCSETRRRIPTQIDARVTCRQGLQKVVFGYQQNT